ncbi:MAG: HAD family phosphatase [Chloroflexi bacterium]|nr:HAD family phosphatase [Chloroflexota bacterium]
MIKAVLFDFDGVLIRTEDRSGRQSWDQQLGLPNGSVERAVHHSDIWIQAQLGRISYDAYWKGVAELLYTTPDNIPAIRADYFSGDRLDFRLLDLIRELREQGCQVALLCNESLQFDARLQMLEIADLFDHVLVSAKTGVMKPDSTAYRIALHTLEVGPLETVFIDDSYVNIRGAQPLGIHTILFRPELDLRTELQKLGCKSSE